MSEESRSQVESRLAMRRDTCAACDLPVFLAEKLVIARTPYHRTCFRCARCNNQLTPGNYYETEEGQYCCEACPDEVSPIPTSMHQKYNEDIMTSTSQQRSSMQEVVDLGDSERSLSDEEESANGTLDSRRSELHETRRTHDSRRSSEVQESTVPDLIAQTSQMRLNFMASHLLSGETSAIDSSGRNSALPDDDDHEDEEEEEEDDEEASSSAGSSVQSLKTEKDVKEPAGEDSRSSGVVNSALTANLDVKADEEQRLTAISFHDVVKSSSVSLNGKEDDTKELLGKADEREDSTESLSLVQQRLRIFEVQDKRPQVPVERKRTKSAFEVQKTDEQSRDQTDKPPENRDNSHCRDVPISHDASSKTESQRTGESLSTKDEPTTVSRVPSSTYVVSLHRKMESDRESESSKLDDSDVQRNKPETSSKGAIALSPEKEEAPSHQVPVNVELSRDSLPADSANETSLTKAEGIDLSTGDEYPEDLNPFNTEDDEEDNVADAYHTAMDTSKRSTNPFDSDEDDEENGAQTGNAVPPKPATRTTIGTNRSLEKPVVDLPSKRRLVAPQINLNPFWSDDDEHDSDLEGSQQTPASAPVPKPRTIKNTPELGIAHRSLDLSPSELYASNTSIASLESATTPGGTYRKKKPAPPPPTANKVFPIEQRTSPMPKAFNSPAGHLSTSPCITPRARKSKPAPPPPMPTSTPYNVTMGVPLNFAESPITEPGSIIDGEDIRMWEDLKTNKDETNRNRQSLTSVPCEEAVSYKAYMDKSVQGKWKRKKGPAPPRPSPHRRKIKVISMKDVKLELEEIELQQQGLEKQGVRLEQLIRDKCECGNNKPDVTDSSLSMDVEELVLELFALVNEKNELFRRQAELMLLRRQQRLEEEHVEVEYQIRCLMSQPEVTKTDFDKQREELLIQRLVEIVERRNEIVECLEMDRRREVEEDRSIHKHMGLYAARNKNEILGSNNDTNNSSKTKKGKAKEKTKEKKSKKTPKKDADKDVDETEVKLKRHSKRKWF